MCDLQQQTTIHGFMCYIIQFYCKYKLTNLCYTVHISCSLEQSAVQLQYVTPQNCCICSCANPKRPTPHLHVEAG